MARLNKVVKKAAIYTNVPRTFEGAVATKIKNPALQLRRLVMANMLWEDQFYIDGESSAGLIQQIIPEIPPTEVAAIAVTAREKGKLRHVPLLLVRELARQTSDRFKKGWPHLSGLVADTLEKVIQRPDELMEFLAIYWKDGKQPLSAQVKRGLARAFAKFNEYSLAKYDQEGAVKLRDVMFLVHPNPRVHSVDIPSLKTGRTTNLTKEALYKRIANRELKTPDTWEVALSAGGDKKEIWTRLLREEKLGGLALLRNLRNMKEAGVERGLVVEALQKMKTERVLPFRFISAATHAPDLEPYLEEAMFKSLEQHEKLKGHTVLLVDISGSMQTRLSGKSDITRQNAAEGLAMLLREIGERVTIASFDTSVREVRPRRGFALRDEIRKSGGGGTDIGKAVRWANEKDADRIIVITDEQSATQVPAPNSTYGYMVNVAAYQNGVGAANKWDKVDGFSEAVVDYIMNMEAEGLNLQLQ